MKIYEPYFDSKSHIYHTPDGTRLEGVTDVLQGELGGYDGFPESAAIRGHEVHKAIQFYTENDINEAGFTSEVLEYLACFQRAEKHHKIKILQTEVMRHHPKYLYAGRMDAIVEIDGIKGIIDYKTGGPDKRNKWQLSMYLELIKKEISEIKGRWNLYLKPHHYDGGLGFKLEEHTGFRDFQEAVALFAAYTIKRNNGYLKDKRRDIAK